MSFNVSNFREALGGGARANLFKISISGVGAKQEIIDLFSTTCKAASLPASTLGLIEVPLIAGRRYKLGGERTFAEWTTTLINTDDYTIRDQLERWQNDIVNTNFDSTTVGDRSSRGGNGLTVTPTLQVEQLNDAGKVVSKFELKHCWPSDISTIDLSYDNTNAIEEFTVTWTYDYYVQVA